MRQEVIAQPEKRTELTEVMIYSRKQVRCQQGRFHRRLFDYSEEGIFVPCKECHCEHLVTWEELGLVQQGFRLVLVHEQVS